MDENRRNTYGGPQVQMSQVSDVERKRKFSI